MLNKISLIPILLLLLVSSVTAKKGLTFRGSAYADMGAAQYISWSESEMDSLKTGGVNVLELNLKNNNREYGKFEGALDLIVPFGHLAQPDTPFVMDLRKLYFTLFFERMDLSIGRQIVNFGKGQVFSPIDVFSTIDIADVHLKRSGSDVAALKIPIGDLSGVDLFAEAPVQKNSDSTLSSGDYSTALRGFTSLGGYDLSIISLYRIESEELLVGADFKGDLILGVYGEFVSHTLKESRYEEFMLGTDYSLPKDFFITLEYLFTNQFQATHRIYGALSQQIDELSSWSVSSMTSPEEKRWMLTVLYQNNILQNADLLLYVRGYQNWVDPIRYPALMPDTECNIRLQMKF